MLPPVTVAGTPIQTIHAYDHLYSTYGVYDPTTELVVRGTMVASVAWTTGDTVTVNHYNSAGVLQDAVSVATTAAARVPFDFTASTASTGNPISKGWTMAPGDSLELVIAATTTAGARGGVGVTLLVSAKGT